jgi:hypothetical protein
MSKKTIALIISLVVLTAALLFVALTTKEPTNNQIATNEGSQPTPTPPAQTILSLSPNPLNATTGTNEVLVEIDSGSNAVTTVQLELAYDPKLITNLKITPDTFLPNAVELLNKNDVTTGRASFALAILPSQPAQTGKGVVARITFNTRPATLITKETELTLLQKSLVTASGVSPSVLKEARSTKVMLPTASAPAQSAPTTQTTQQTAPSQ